MSIGRFGYNMVILVGILFILLKSFDLIMFLMMKFLSKGV